MGGGREIQNEYGRFDLARRKGQRRGPLTPAWGQREVGESTGKPDGAGEGGLWGTSGVNKRPTKASKAAEGQLV